MSGERINILIALMALVFVGAVKGQSRAQQPSAQVGGESPETDGRQIEVLLGTKAQRTPAQRKVSSQLLDAQRAAVAARRQVQGASVADELVTVDIRTDITPAVLARIRALGGTVINSVSRYRAIRARLPLASVEKLAALDAIQSIRAAAEAATPGQPTEIPSGARADAPEAAGTRTGTGGRLRLEGVVLVRTGFLPMIVRGRIELRLDSALNPGDPADEKGLATFHHVKAFGTVKESSG